jgi:hypothetical protein
MMHGSAWPSHRGNGFLEKSLVQLSLEASWVARGSVCGYVDGEGGVESGVWATINGSGGGVSFVGLGSAGLERDWKKPFRDC